MFKVEGKFFPSRHLMTITARDMVTNVVELEGSTGLRTIARPSSGTFEGLRIRGEILSHLANEWRTQSPFDPTIESLEGLIVLQSEDGATILMKYIGRRSARYGSGEWRLGVCFEAGMDKAAWLNELVAVAYVKQVDDDFVFTVHELVRADAGDPEQVMRISPLYQMIARDSVGERYTIQGPVAHRYFSVAERGCRVKGILNGEWIEGFSWGPHRLGPNGGMMPIHIDMRVAMRTDDGAAIIQHYIGVSQTELMSPEPNADRSWRTTAVFEAPRDSTYSWLNGIVAIGLGWTENNEAQYCYYLVE